jgi:branched-chain amino acid transport system permease protein
MIAQIITNSIIAGSIYSLIAFGFTLIYGTMGFFNMAYGANVMLGAYFFFLMYRKLSLPLSVSAIVACLITAIFVLVIDRVCYYGLRQKRSPKWANVVVSMAVAVLIQAFIVIAFGNSVKNVYIGIPPSFEIFGVYITTVQIAIIISAVIIMAVTSAYLQKSKTGKIIRAIANDSTMAKVVGIDVERVYRAVIVLGSLLATSAAILISLNSDLKPTISSSTLLKAIVASIIGGVGSVKGAMFAGLLLGFAENFTILGIGSGWENAVPLVLIVVLMLLKPSMFGIEETK